MASTQFMSTQYMPICGLRQMDRRIDRHTDDQYETIIPRHCCVAGYKKNCNRGIALERSAENLLVGLYQYYSHETFMLSFFSILVFNEIPEHTVFTLGIGTLKLLTVLLLKFKKSLFYYLLMCLK